MQKYQMCFLGYQQLTKIAARVIENLPYDDTEIRLVDCNVETLSPCVKEALLNGCEMFVAGAGNAAEFGRTFSAPITVIRFKEIDYLLAIKKAVALGSKLGIVSYRYARQPKLQTLRELSGACIEMIMYEDGNDLLLSLNETTCDVIIGASHANQVAAELGKCSVLLYPGEEAILDTIKLARRQLQELRRQRRNEVIINAILRNSSFGIIVSDESDSITLCNQVARNYIGILPEHARGRSLGSIVPVLSTEPILSGKRDYTDQLRLLQGSMVRCVQTRISDNNETVSVLTTLHLDNRTKKKNTADQQSEFSARGHWEDLVADSPVMQATVKQARFAASIDIPILIRGEPGTGHELFAQCIHNSSQRANQPYMVIDLVLIPDDGAAKYLFGCEDNENSVTGLFELANHGTILIKNVHHASYTIQSAIVDILSKKEILRLGAKEKTTLDLRFIVLQNSMDQDISGMQRELYDRISVLCVDLPPLRERSSDIENLFINFVNHQLELHRKFELTTKMTDTLKSYSWPGNLRELSTICKRYSILLNQTVKSTASSKHLLLVQAIGEDVLYNEIVSSYLKTQDTECAPAEQLRTCSETLKRILCYSNSKIASRLGISRTSLWRFQKQM